jgi:hypothetical protein
MFNKKMLMMSLLALSSSAAFAGATYDCQISKYSVQDKPYGKGQNTVCGQATLSDQVGNNNAYFDNCDSLSLSIENLGDIGGYSVELAKLKPGKAEDWMSRSPLRYAVITVENGDDAPKKFGLKLGDEISHTLKANDAVEYSAVCTQK